MVDPLGCKACRAIRQPNQPIQSDTGSLDPKSPKTSQFSVIRRFLGIESHASESYYHSYTVATSGVHRLASQVCRNRLFRKKLQQNILPMISTEVSSLAAHNSLKIGSASPSHVPATIACFRDILQQIALLTRGRPPPYESSSSGLAQRTKLFFRSMTLALQCVPGTGRTAWTSAGTTRMFCPS
jgi:hypothetical protein